MPRPAPFDLVFAQFAQEVFPKIRLTLVEAGQDPRNRDQFLMVREVVTLVRELRPEEGLGEGIDQLAALVHHAYLYWEAEEQVIEVTADQLASLLGTNADLDDSAEVPSAYYVQMPQHRIWAEVLPGQPPEPLDGCFVHTSPEGTVLRVLGVFGIHPEREGFSVVEASGRRPSALMRADGTDLFSPTLTGGKAAGLFSIVGAEELLELGWRTREVGAGSPHPVPSA
jgi:hypothetical protein